MKKFLSTLVALVFATATFAQVQSDIRTATLIHGEKTSVFYGAGAFADAYNASVDGDIIVLSSGYFNTTSTNITKSLTIYGAGYETDTISGAAPTHISKIFIAYNEGYDDYGEKTISYPTVRLEGLLLDNSGGTGWNVDHQPSLTIWDGGTLENLTVRKCKIYSIALTPASKNCQFSQCVIEKLGHIENTYQYGWSFTAGLYNEHKNLNFENCWIKEAEGSSLTSTINYDHCIICRMDNNTYGNYAHFTNSILNCTLLENCTTHNCIFTTSSTGNNVTAQDCWTGAEIAGIFIDATQGFEYSATNNFKLRFPMKYVGTDGTEVGINGGNAPFDRISPIPRILSSDIDIRTTNEGKLKVNLKIQAQTKE